MEENPVVSQLEADLGRYGPKSKRAFEAAATGCVKECRFLPSGRRVLSVVGRYGDEFIDPERPYCSCSNYFFRVSNRREETCYHLLSYAIAMKTGKVDVVEFNDDEYVAYVRAIVEDVFQVLVREAGQG